VASSIVSRTFASVVLSTLRMFRSSSGVSPIVLCKVVEDEPQKFTSFVRLTAFLRKFPVLYFQGATFGLHMFRFLVVVARHRSPGLASVSRRVRLA
jgi:hypothetical protein